MLKCSELVADADHLLDRTGSVVRRAQLRMHVLFCHHCRRYVHQLKLLRSWLQRKSQQLDEGALRDVLKDIEQRRDERRGG